MKKYYLIEQPPVARKYTFLVDDISDKLNYGLATDIHKINYNLKLMGEKFNIDVKVGLLMAESKGSTFVFDLGHFISILELRADQQEGKMAFYDCVIDIPRSELNEILVKRYSQNIATEWFKVHDRLNVNLSPETDIVQIIKPDF